ncbi:MAG: uroporphyrinogen-III C-methyltransferase [Nitrospirota bacterium]|nr:uroporphyrinogen-III C-methyltransferase [Nitrospirota bacterium]
MSRTGTVYLIGAGPGDPGLITVKGLECLEAAQVVVYDYLANPALLESLAPEVERVYAGKRHGNHHMRQEDINALLVERAQRGLTVARLKGGDPFIFGRGGEEAAALASAGVPFEVVPGVTAATAVTAYAGIPLTHRGLNATVTFVTGQEDPSRPDTRVQWDELARTGGTLVFFMGIKRLPHIARRLIAGGLSPDTPAAAIRWGTHPAQHTVSGTLDNLAQRVEEARLQPPALIVVGEVVTLREQINWFESLPLFGRRILVTRAAGQQGQLARALDRAGADVVAVPTIRIVPPDDPAPLHAATAALDKYRWLVVTSANGVDSLFASLGQHGKDSRALAGVRIAAVGTETARALANHGIHADLVPADARAEGLATALVEQGVKDQNILLVQAAQARPVLPETLAAHGARVEQVTAYRSEAPETLDRERLLAAPLDYAVFTSSSTVRNLHRLLGDAAFRATLAPARTCAIGPVTAATCRELGLTVHLQPDTPAVAALVDAIRTDAATLGPRHQRGGHAPDTQGDTP